MGSPQGDSQISFAKVAAMPSASNFESLSIPDNNEHTSPAGITSDSLDNANSSLSGQHSLQIMASQEHTHEDPLVDGIRAAVQDIEIIPRKEHEESVSSLDGQEGGLLKREHFFDDDHTQLSSSSTKMTNFDSKSLASVTTFAMDENNSVRPDDSASVQAIDEEESLSGPASGAPNSVTGSEAGGRAFKDFRDGNAQRPRGVLPIPGPLFIGSNQHGNVSIPPDSVSNNFVTPEIPSGLPDGASPHGFPLHPDEKLVEAMKSPKDRLLILQLEEKIRYFISNSSEQSLELPPSNAFGRLLAHKLGDYYHLTHFVDNNVTSVRLHRTPFCRLPTPLSAVHAAINTTPPPNTLPKKIMRRTDGDRPSTEGSVGASSSAASKAPSESGETGTDGDQPGSSTGTPGKDRSLLSREEREAKYNEARERIFRDFPDNPKSDPASGESSHNMSRSSSMNGRKKNNNSNNRQRPQDDGFEGRSQFNTYYVSGMGPYNSSMPYNGNMGDASYPNQVPYLVGPGVSPPTNSFVPQGQNGSMYPGSMGVNNMQPYQVSMSPQMSSGSPWQGGNMPQQSTYSGYSSINQPGMMSQQSSTKSSPAMNNYAIPQPGPYQQATNWNTQPYSGNYQQPMTQRNQPPVHWPNYPTQSITPNMTGYSYNQYPGQHLNSGYQNHPSQMMSGGPRSHFNPQTRSFVPGGPSPSRHPNKGPQYPMPPYANMQPNQGQWTGFPDQSHNRNIDHSSASNPSRPSNPNSSTNSLAKWGTPSHLPPKPPPSEVPSDFDIKHRGAPLSVPPAASFAGGNLPGSKNGPLVVSGGMNGPKPN